MNGELLESCVHIFFFFVAGTQVMFLQAPGSQQDNGALKTSLIENLMLSCQWAIKLMVPCYL